jgi:uncharacterized protein YndB with AHSA1/START domain
VSTHLRPDGEVILTRSLRHPPAKVFEAWSRAEQLERWLKPGRDVRMKAQVDCRVGGGLTFTFFNTDGTINRVEGSYLVVRPPERLVFTWTWKSREVPAGTVPLPMPVDSIGVETLVTVDFAARPDGTLLTITHQRFESGSEAERHAGGWTGALDQLPNHLELQSGDIA